MRKKENFIFKKSGLNIGKLWILMHVKICKLGITFLDSVMSNVKFPKSMQLRPKNKLCVCVKSVAYI